LASGEHKFLGEEYFSRQRERRVNVFEGDERLCVIEHILFDFSPLS
jgi:hypothetical protein